MAVRRGPGISLREPRERLVASVRVKCHPSQLRHAITEAQHEVLDVIGAEGLAPAGPMFTRYHSIGPIAELEVGVPLAQTVRPNQRVVNSTLPGGPALHATSMGSRAQLLQTVNSLHEYLKTAHLTAAGGYWEYYIVEPLPGLDRGHVELYLPVLGIHTNGRRPQVPDAQRPEPKALVAIEVRPETSGRSIFARHGPRWEEGALEVDAPSGSRSTQAAGTNRSTNETDRASDPQT
jgi:effector-binding domain-containing protein